MVPSKPQDVSHSFAWLGAPRASHIATVRRVVYMRTCVHANFSLLPSETDIKLQSACNCSLLWIVSGKRQRVKTRRAAQL